MEAYRNKPKLEQGGSIITCTKRRRFLKNVFLNYLRQSHAKKELLIIVNNDEIPLSPYQQLAKKLGNVQVFRMPERHSLGECLNYAVKKAKYGYIAKFDDDDYYASYYLDEMMLAFRKTKADIVGKRAHYMYLSGSKKLILRFAEDEHRYVSVLPGATLVMKRHVFNRVRFPSQNVGEDDSFCTMCKAKGYKIYSAGKYNFVALRRKNASQHTWVISDQELIAYHKTVPHVRNIKRFVRRKPRAL